MHPRDLPRRGSPDTLPSIFDEPFPVTEDKTVIRWLKSPSLRQDARMKRDAERKEKERKIEERRVARERQAEQAVGADASRSENIARGSIKLKRG